MSGYRRVLVQHLQPGMVYRREPDHGWKVCFSSQIERYNLDFCDVLYLSRFGRAYVYAYFTDTEVEVAE